MRTPDQIETLIPVSDRSAQRFPRLSDAQLHTIKRFAGAEPRRFAANEPIFAVGDYGVPAWFLLEGSVLLFIRDGFDEETTLQELQPGQFTGELHALADRPTLVGATAGAGGCLALPLNAGQLRSLIVGSAELGETIMRAFILRRVGLLERGVGPILLGRAGSADLLRLQAFLTRSSYPHMVLDCASERGSRLIRDLALPPEELPLLVCPCGRVLKRPSNAEAGAWLGITPTLNKDAVYDVAVIGSGPAGLATAVYAASEGLSVVVLDGQVVGGQAGASARIENYLGFPTGISGLALTGRALNQAQKFGAEVAVPLVATRLNCPDTASAAPQPIELTLSEQGSLKARSVVIATGARYKRPDLARLGEFEGDCLHYWASPVEAKLCSNEEVALVGAGNSAGQAIVFLSSFVKRLSVIVRGAGLEASMSRYLIDRISSLENVDILVRSELAELLGDRTQGLHGVTVRNKDSGAITQIPARQVFMFIGAEPNTAWLEGCVALDEKGYVLTGELIPEVGQPPALPLQTSVAGVFAIGDVRSGSTKRVASAVGEGASVVSQIHAMLGAAGTGGAHFLTAPPLLTRTG
jgi:thioredoxin reductase (NADPH)